MTELDPEATDTTHGSTVLDIPLDAVIVLDVDDTLYLERSYVRSGFAAVGRHLSETRGVDGVGDTLWAGFEAGVRGDAFDRALAAHGLAPDPALVTELVELYRGHRPDIELLPDAARLLSRLDERPTGVITDGPAISQWAKVEALGLPGRIDRIVVTSELGPDRSKPHPLPYLTIEDDLRAAAGTCWYLADNPKKDFVTPLARGWTAVRIRRDQSLHAALATPAGAVEITSLDQLRC